MRKLYLLISLFVFVSLFANVQPVKANVNYILMPFELQTPSHYDPDWEVPCFRVLSIDNPMPTLDRLNFYVQPIGLFPDHSIFSDPSQQVAMWFNFGYEDVQYGELSAIFFMPGGRFVTLDRIYQGQTPQGIGILQDGMLDQHNQPIDFSTVDSFAVMMHICYVPFSDWENIELTIETAVSKTGWLNWLNNEGHFEDFAPPIQVIEGTPLAVQDMDTTWLIAFFSMFSAIFGIELLPNLRVGFIIAIPIIFAMFMWFLKIVRGQ